jgi:hypothetical protein
MKPQPAKRVTGVRHLRRNLNNQNDRFIRAVARFAGYMIDSLGPRVPLAKPRSTLGFML